jgi:hypothetical protein
VNSILVEGKKKSEEVINGQISRALFRKVTLFQNLSHKVFDIEWFRNLLKFKLMESKKQANLVVDAAICSVILVDQFKNGFLSENAAQSLVLSQERQTQKAIPLLKIFNKTYNNKSLPSN